MSGARQGLHISWLVPGLGIKAHTSARSSSALIGMFTPPKSVKWVQLQYSQPSGRPDGGGEAMQPSESQSPLEFDQKRQATAMSHAMPVKPTSHSHKPASQVPNPEQKLYSEQSPLPYWNVQCTGGGVGGGAPGGSDGGG